MVVESQCLSSLLPKIRIHSNNLTCHLVKQLNYCGPLLHMGCLALVNWLKDIQLQSFKTYSTNETAYFSFSYPCLLTIPLMQTEALNFSTALFLNMNRKPKLYRHARKIDSINTKEKINIKQEGRKQGREGGKKGRGDQRKQLIQRKGNK